jgi:hypothetical protein
VSLLSPFLISELRRRCLAGGAASADAVVAIVAIVDVVFVNVDDDVVCGGVIGDGIKNFDSREGRNSENVIAVVKNVQMLWMCVDFV